MRNAFDHVYIIMSKNLIQSILKILILDFVSNYLSKLKKIISLILKFQCLKEEDMEVKRK